MHESTNNPDTTPEICLVTGGTGKTGHRVAARLQALGRTPRVGSRSGDPAFDWNDRRTWPAALADVASVYIAFAPDLAVPGAMDTIRAFTKAAVDAGVRRVVLLSGRGEPEARNCEQIIQQADVAWTIVRASWFNQNFSEGEFVGMVREGSITLPARNIAEPFVDADDIADVVVAALTEPGHEYEIYEVTGPRLLTFTDVAAEISRATGRQVNFVPIPRQAFTRAVAESGAPGETVWLLDYLFDRVLDGRNAHTCDGVQRALGRAPRDFTRFARHIAASDTWEAATGEPTN